MGAACNHVPARRASAFRPYGLPWLIVLLVLAGAAASGMAVAIAATEADGSRQVAESLAKMLQSARAVISKHQTEINDPAKGDKGLTAAVVLAEASANYKTATGIDPSSYAVSTRQGRLLHAQMDAITEVVDANQALINRPGVAFKGFIPATFARLVNEAFARRVGTEASVKVTAPPDLVRNRKARPDAWEVGVINTDFLNPSWKHGVPYAEDIQAGGKGNFRMMVPEYYAASCLSCHGGPKGSLDITGYPREGAAEGDLGGVISVSLQD